MKEKVIRWMKTAPKVSHTIRILAGAYLIYMSYSMFTDPTSEINAFVIICGVLFVVIGAFFLATSLYALSKGCYSDYVDMSSFDEEEDEVDVDENDTQT